MYEINKERGTIKVFCDRCAKELTEDVYVLQFGDILCKDCFKKEYEIMTAEEYSKKMI